MPDRTSLPRQPISQARSDSDFWSSVAGRMASANATNPYHDRFVADLNNALECRKLVSMIRRHFPDGRELLTLDVGAGCGRFSEIAAKFGVVHALEPSELARVLQSRAERCGNIKVFRTTVERFSTEDLYDLIIISGVLMELSDPVVVQVTRKLEKTMKPGALVFIRDCLSPSTTRTCRGQQYTYYARPMYYWNVLLHSSNLCLDHWCYSHAPFLLFYLCRRLPSMKPLQKLMYSPSLVRYHLCLDAVLGLFVNRIFALLDKDRIALFFAVHGKSGTAPG